MNNETLKFKIGLSGTYWDKKPEFKIFVDNICTTHTSITAPTGEVEYVEFTADVEEEKEHSLRIQLLNKEETDVVKTADETGIEKDMLLNIETIEIDDIELEFLKWSLSMFTPDTPFSGYPKNMTVNLGLNGTYEIKFDSPFYIWLLSNM